MKEVVHLGSGSARAGFCAPVGLWSVTSKTPPVPAHYMIVLASFDLRGMGAGALGVS